MRKLLMILLAGALLLSACAANPAGNLPPTRKVRIGFSMDTLQEERWQRDRDLFVAKARELGAEVIFQAAAGDDYLQLSQAETMLERGVDVLVVVPHDADAMAPVVDAAHAKGVKVLAYDRLITQADVDLYVSFDNERVGQLQAEYMTRLVPAGNYVYIGGAPTDNNAHLFRQGALKELEPHRARGAINLVADAMSSEWLPEIARQNMEAALAKGPVDAVIAANDGTAGGVIQALYGHGLAGKVPVSGQDADLAAVRRIVAGTQTATVYKPIRLLAARAAEIAVAMAKGASPQVNAKIHNGYKEVPAFLLTPVLVDRHNLRETVIRDGFHREADVFGPSGQ